MNIIDRTRESMGWNNPFQTRRTDQIRKIVIHHSATAGGNMAAFENAWRNKGWRNGGYHEIILLSGDVELCYVPTTVTNGAFGHNTNAYHICVVGNFRTNGVQPSVVQIRSLMTRVRHNMKRFSVPVSKVKGHKELNPTICPGMKMADFRNTLHQSQGVVNSDLTVRLTGSQGQTVLGVNFRRGAGTNHARIRTLAKGTMFETLGRSGLWTRVCIGNDEGWISTRFTRRAAGRILNQGEGQTTARVNFRIGAGTNHARIRTLPQGQMLQVLGRDGDWQRVRIGDRTGFVHQRYTRFNL